MVMKQKNARMQGGGVEVATERWVAILQLKTPPAFLAFQIHVEMPAGNSLYRNRGGKKMLIILFHVY
jgi:hypothetical protein